MSEMRTIAVAGNGNTAVVVAACLALVGHRVVGVETRHTKLQALETAPVPSFEPGLTDLLETQQRAGRLSFGSDIGTAVQQADVTFLCVEGRSIPSDPSGVEPLATAVRSIGEAAGRGHVIVVTTPLAMGNGTWLGSIIEDALTGNGHRPSLVSHPGFMRDGQAVSDFLTPEHVVIGSDDQEALARVIDLLGPILDQSHAGGNPLRKPDVIRTDLVTAEGIKRAVSDNVARAAADLTSTTDRHRAPGSGDGGLPLTVGFDVWNKSKSNAGFDPNGNGASPATARQHPSETAGGVIPKWKRQQHHRGRTSHPTVTVVIPTLNEADNLPHVISRIPESVDEVVIVDGLSTDRTVEVARRLLPDCVVILEERPGKGVALRSGFERATSDIVVMLDADGSTDPREIPAFVGMLVSGTDFVKGSRFIQGGGTADMERHRKLGNRALTILVNIAFGGRFSDLCYGYIAMWRDTLPAMDLGADGFEIETLMGIRALRADLEIAEVPSFECRRIHGTSNLRAIRDGFRILRTIIRERLRPFRPPAETAPTAFGANAAGTSQPSAAALEAELLRT